MENKSKSKKNLQSSSLDDRCIWYEKDCKDAGIDYHSKKVKRCDGYNQICFAYLSYNIIQEREKESDLKEIIGN